MPDPDGRADIATSKMRNLLLNKNNIETTDIKNILLESPNFNELTLMTTVIDVKNGIIDFKIWSKPTQDRKSVV